MIYHEDMPIVTWKAILENEGGYTDDTGGPTKYGVSLRFLKTLPTIEADINHDGKVTVEDIEDLTWEDAYNIYNREFWKRLRLGEIQSPRIATKILDMTINLGPATAVKMVQRTVETKQDGIIGPKTIAAINKAYMKGEDNFILRLCYAQGDRYLELIFKNPKLWKYRDGWLTRAEKNISVGF